MRTSTDDTLTDREVAPAELVRGTVVGRYIVLSRLGSGGMGIVYAAYDPELDRKVALKLLRAEVGASMSSGDGRTRLVREAQALAKLTHPNVVVVHDVGTMDDRVWLAMEFVDGETLGAWFRRERRPWPAVLDVMVAAGRGLAAVHAAGLVHRDFKPDNVMVAADGRVLVMDFGVARAGERGTVGVDEDTRVRPREAALGADVTRAGSVLGTPAYMAPEQHLGLSADARSDQFAYAVTFWEALYGQRPFAGDSMAALAFAVTQGRVRPPPPGARRPAWLRRAVQRGLAPEPGARWPSMPALLGELSRGEQNVRRRRVFAGLGALGIVVALAGGSMRLRDRAAVEACETSAGAVDEVWNESARERVRAGLLATQVPYSAAAAEQVETRLDEWTARWREARASTCLRADEYAGWSADLHDRADECLDERLTTLEALVGTLGLADAVVAQSAVRAVVDLETATACDDPVALSRRPALPEGSLVQVQGVREILSRALALELRGRYAESIELVEHALARPGSDAPAFLEAEVALALGRLMVEAGDFERAAERLTEAYVKAGRSGAVGVAADAAVHLVFVAKKQARHDEGFVWATVAEVAVHDAEGDEGLRTASLRDNLAHLHSATGSYERAGELHEQALALRERLLGADHPDVAASLGNLAGVLRVVGDYGRARELQERSLAVLEQALGPDHPDVGTSLVNLANVDYSTGAYERARPLYERSLRIKERALGPTHLDLALGLNNIALVDEAVGDYVRAEERQRRALAIREQALGPDHPDVAASLNNLGNLHQLTGRFREARELFARALAIKEKVLPPGHADIALGLNNLANTHVSLGEYAQAKALYERALAAYRGSLGLEHPDVALTLVNLAYAHHLLGENDEATAYCRQALTIYEKALGPDNPRIVDVLLGMGEIARARGRADEAVPWLERAVGIRERSDPPAEDLAEVRFSLARALWDSDRQRERAVELAALARTGYATVPTRAQELADVDAWLAAHRVRR